MTESGQASVDHGQPSSAVLDKDTDGNFHRFWVGQALAVFSALFCRELIPLVGLLALACTPGQIGVMRALETVATIVFALFAGSWCDRGMQRKLLLGANAGRILVLSTIPLAAAASFLSVPQLYIVAFSIGAFSAMFGVADNAALPLIVDRRFLIRANSRLETTSSLAELSGPGLAGGLAGVLGAPLTVIVAVVSLIFSSLAFSGVRFRVALTPPGSASMVAPGSAWNMVRQDHKLACLLGSSVAFSFFGSFIACLYLPFCLQDLKLSPLATGLTISAGGIGSLLGAMFTPRLIRHLGVGSAAGIGLVIAGMVQIVFVLVRGTGWSAAAWLGSMQLAGDFFITLFLISSTSIRQALTPEAGLGRVSALFTIMGGIFGAFGAILAGHLAEAFGFRPIFMVCLCGVIGSSLFVFLAPELRSLRVLVEPQEN